MAIQTRPAASAARALCAGVLATLALLPAPARAQALRENLWMPNGPVNAIAVRGNTIYLGGSFSRVGPPTGSFVSIDAATGDPIPPFPYVSGVVTTIVGDGNGGWYIGGYFSSVGGQPRSNVAHLDATGSPTAWNPGTDFPVDVLLFDSTTGTVYVGGYFNTIGGQVRSGLAAVDGVTGVPTAWNPHPIGSPARVFTLALYGTTMYVGGGFTDIGGQPRNNLASVDTATGAALTWNPNVNKSVFGIWLRTSDAFPFTRTLYVCGAFDTIGGQVRNFIASVDADTGVPTSWQPDADNFVRKIVVTSGPSPRQPIITVYAAGDFHRLGAQTRNYLGAVNAAGLATSWFPDPNSGAFALGAANGVIYAGGGFTSVGGQPRRYLAALDPATGAATSWDPALNSYPQAFASSGNSIIVGGSFSSVGGPIRNNIAAIDAVTGQPTTWDPNADGAISALLVIGSTLYVGGQFTGIGGQARINAAALDLGTGTATSWNPSPNGQVMALALRSLSPNLNLIYMGGAFTTVAGQTRYRLAAMDDGTVPQLSGWSPFVDNEVHALAVHGQRIYAGGAFTGSITALNLDGTPNNSFYPTPSGPCYVDAIVASADRVYVGGSFHYLGGRVRDNLAALDTLGRATTLDPFTDDLVEALVLNGSTLYVGGRFAQFAGAQRYGVGALDVSTGRLTNFGADALGYEIRSIALGDGATYLGGDFAYQGLVLHWHFTGFGAVATGVDVPIASVEPERLRLSSNPFRDQLSLQFDVPDAAQADVRIYDTAGRQVRRLEPNKWGTLERRATWDGRDESGTSVSAGVYFVRVRAGTEQLSAKVLRLR
jgi:hypothetical protein